MNQTLNIMNRDVKIPVLPPGATYLMQKLSDEEISFEELASVVERFASISARLVSLANSAWAGSTTEVTSVRDACTRLGLNVVRSTSIALAISAPFNPNRCQAFQPERYWIDSMLVAEAAYGLAPAIMPPADFCSQTMRTAGLLHNLGLLWMADNMPDETQKALILAQKNPEFSVSQALTLTCGFDYCIAAEAIAKAWELPHTLVIMLGQQSHEDYRDSMWQGTQLISLSKQIIHALREEQPDALQALDYEHIGIRSRDIRAQYARLEQLQPRIHALANTLFLS